MEHADRFLRRFYIERGMFGSLSLTFIFYRPPLLGDYPTVGSNGLESRTTKSEFFWVYFGVFLALGFGGAERPKTLIINLHY